MSFPAILIVLLAVAVGIGLYLRRFHGQRNIPASFATLKDISSQGHYALFVDGHPVNSEFNSSGDVKLALFTLVPASTEFNPQAVMVFFGPHLVGSLSRKDGESYWTEYGQEKTKCRGIHQIVDNLHNVWLDINVGSAVLGVSSVLQSPQLWQLFPIPTVIEPEQVGTVNDFLANNMVRVFDARLIVDGPKVQVLVDGVHMGYLPPELAEVYIRTHANSTVSSMALVRRSVSGPIITLLANNKLRDLLF